MGELVAIIEKDEYRQFPDSAVCNDTAISERQMSHDPTRGLYTTTCGLVINDR